MIAKKIPNPTPNKSANKQARISSLVRYIWAPENRRKRKEKCVYAGQRGFIVDDLETVIKAMTGTAMAASRSPDTIAHYVLGWPDGECPDKAQVEEAVTIFMHELGIDELECVFGLHSDTDNSHLHIVVNRVHPESGRCVAINNGFDVEAIHRAAAKIEKAQGWSQCAHYLREGPGNDAPGLSTRSRDHEARTGEESAQRRAIEEAAPLIKAARSWAELHESLREVSMRYEKKGSGAIVYVGSIPVKASKVARSATLAQLERRLGPFVPAKHVAAAVPEPEAKPVKDSPELREYLRSRRQHATDAKEARAKLWDKHKSEREALSKSQRDERESLRRQGDWRGRRAQLAEQRSLLAMRHAQDKAALKERQRAEREALPSAAFPSFKEWLEAQNCPEAKVSWRYRNHGAPWGMITGTQAPREEEVDIRGFVPQAVNGRVHYYRLGCHNKAAFTDNGNHILVHDVHERANILAALQLATQKWGTIKVWGCPEYIDACVDLAAKHGFKIVNPELQERIGRRREELHKPAAPDWERLARDASEKGDRKGLEDIVDRYERARKEIASEIAANLAKDVARAREAVAKNERIDKEIDETIDQANSVKGVLTDVVTFGGSYRKANKRIADLERRKTPGAQERLEQAEKEEMRFANVGSSGYFAMLHHEMEKKHPGLAEAGLLAQKELRKLEAEARAKRLAEEKSRNAGKTPPSNNGWSR